MRAQAKMLALGLLLLAGAADAVAEPEEAQPTYEVVDKDDIYFGSGKSPKAPATIRVDDVWAEIPEYKKILADDLGDDDPEYHLLFKKATERFNKALEKVAKRESYDMIGEEGAIKVKGKSDVKIPDATADLIEVVTRG